MHRKLNKILQEDFSRNLKSLYFICSHSFLFVVPLAVIRCHSMSFFATRCHSLSLLSLFVIHCDLLSLDVPLICLLINNHFKLKYLLKGALSGLRQFLATESPLKIMKNAFYFTSKAHFVLKVFRFLSWLFGHVTQRLDKKD